MKNRILFSSVGLFFILTACSSGKKAENETSTETQGNNLLQMTSEQVKANDMHLGQLQEFTFTRKVEATGFLEALPRNKRSVTIWEGGTIKNLNLIPGDYVKTGQFLFSIENPGLLQLQEDFLTASESLKYQQDDYERQKLLESEDVATKKVLLKAESEYFANRARVEALKARLTLLKIDPEKIRDGKMVSSVPVFAPINGYITKVEGDNGKYVSEQSEILEIVQTSPLMLSLSVFEKDITKVTEGLTVRFTVPDVSVEVFEARIEKVGKTLDEKRTVPVHALFSPEGRFNLLPGMFVKAEIITEAFQAQAIPFSALVSFDDHHFVLIKTNREEDHWILMKKMVTIGYQDGNMVEVLPDSQITTEDQIVVSGAFGVVTE